MDPTVTTTEPIVSFLTNKLETYLTDLRTLVNIDSGSQPKAGEDAVNSWLAERLAKLIMAVADEHCRQNGL